MRVSLTLSKSKLTLHLIINGVPPTQPPQATDLTQDKQHDITEKDVLSKIIHHFLVANNQSHARLNIPNLANAYPIFIYKYTIILYQLFLAYKHRLMNVYIKSNHLKEQYLCY